MGRGGEGGAVLPAAIPHLPCFPTCSRAQPASGARWGPHENAAKQPRTYLQVIHSLASPSSADSAARGRASQMRCQRSRDGGTAGRAAGPRHCPHGTHGALVPFFICSPNTPALSPPSSRQAPAAPWPCSPCPILLPASPARSWQQEHPAALPCPPALHAHLCCPHNLDQLSAGQGLSCCPSVLGSLPSPRLYRGGFHFRYENQGGGHFGLVNLTQRRVPADRQSQPLPWSVPQEWGTLWDQQPWDGPRKWSHGARGGQGMQTGAFPTCVSLGPRWLLASPR